MVDLPKTWKGKQKGYTIMRTMENLRETFPEPNENYVLYNEGETD